MSLTKLYNKTPKGIYHLEVEQAVYVPSTKNGNQPISQSEMNKRVESVRKFLSKKYGGYTSVQAVGGYYSTDKKQLIKEKVVKVTSFATNSAYNKNKTGTIRQVRRWASRWGQESMGYEHETDMYYIPGREQRKRVERRMPRTVRHSQPTPFGILDHRKLINSKVKMRW